MQLPSFLAGCSPFHFTLHHCRSRTLPPSRRCKLPSHTLARRRPHHHHYTLGQLVRLLSLFAGERAAGVIDCAQAALAVASLLPAGAPRAQPALVSVTVDLVFTRCSTLTHTSTRPIPFPSKRPPTPTRHILQPSTFPTPHFNMASEDATRMVEVPIKVPAPVDGAPPSLAEPASGPVAEMSGALPTEHNAEKPAETTGIFQSHPLRTSSSDRSDRR